MSLIVSCFVIIVNVPCLKRFLETTQCINEYMSHSQMLGKFEYTLPAKF